MRAWGVGGAIPCECDTPAWTGVWIWAADGGGNGGGSRVDVGGQRQYTKRGAGLVQSMLHCWLKYRSLEAEGAADGGEHGGKQSGCGWTKSRRLLPGLSLR